jgi:hypothetical protein
MRRIYQPKNIVVILAILFSSSLAVLSCNNTSKSDSKETDTTTVKKDTMPVPDNTNMMDDTSSTETPKGEQIPPPK